MGKSSLLMRTVKAGLDAGKRLALLDFQLVDEATKADATLFFRRFASSIAEQLELPDTVGSSNGTPASRIRRTARATSNARSCSR